ncbi:MAG TPA: FKBP-type peptidyl-prolyl cis-trans isomerase [Fimbriimonadaceae bacterium]|nr:FKBP-type peptidyl-prolyl cis-trans isomerase [Fimbriimonadaceae bacterium]
MILPSLALAIVLQQGSPTTPIANPKPAHRAVHAKRKSKKIQRPEPPKNPWTDGPAGSGEPVTDGEIVVIQFLVEKSTGERIADSQKRGLPYTFKIGETGNDPLLDRVVKGMRVGGVRTGTVSAKDAYGPEGMPPLIKPDDSLVVKIALLRREEK